MSSEHTNRAAAVIVAAGRGIRFENKNKKQFAELLGHSVVAWSLSAFASSEFKDRIVVAAQSEDIPLVKNEILNKYSFVDSLHFVKGGETRQQSVYNALLSLPDYVRWVAIHDAVRPAVTPEIITAVLENALECGAALTAVRAIDSTFTSSDSSIGEYLKRETLWHAQTPQIFDKEKIIDAHKRALKENYFSNDDANLYHKYIGKVHIVEGDTDNIKLTYQNDLVIAEEILKKRANVPE